RRVCSSYTASGWYPPRLTRTRTFFVSRQKMRHRSAGVLPSIPAHRTYSANRRMLAMSLAPLDGGRRGTRLAGSGCFGHCMKQRTEEEEQLPRNGQPLQCVVHADEPRLGRHELPALLLGNLRQEDANRLETRAGKHPAQIHRGEQTA